MEVSELDLSHTLAIQISSKALRPEGMLFDEEELLWLILRPGYDPGDKLPRYYPKEIPILSGKTVAELRKIHEVKKTFLESRVRE